MRRFAALPVLFAATRAFAHGSVPTPAVFTAPPQLTATVSDAGDRVFDPYTWAKADASYGITFTDGDTDPFAHYDFYYTTFAPAAGYSLAQVQAMATPIPDIAGGLWAACTCDPAVDFGSPCPDAGARACANGFSWNTSQLPAGTYWPIAIANDPPFFFYTTSQGPLLVNHGGAQLPAAIVVQPDGFGTFDKSYVVRWLMTGTAPFHVDLAYASEDDIAAGQDFAPLASDVPYTQESDGSYDWTWDLTSIPSGHLYDVKLTVTDANGKVFTESTAGLSVSHASAHPDMAIASIDTHKGGCDATPSGTGTGLLVAGVFFAIVTVMVGRRRA